MKFGIVIIVLLGSLWSCYKDDSLATQNNSDYIELKQPKGFPSMTMDVENNPFTQEGFQLGRKLFYDVRLSGDNSISCAECHNQSHVFTHHGHSLSEGVQERLGTRNSQPIQNLAFMKDFTWNGAVANLWKQPKIPIEAEVEMNQNFLDLVEELNQIPEYKQQFAKAFPNQPVISQVNISKAMELFMGAMISDNSTYDQYKRGEVEFTESQKQGLQLFQQKCATCHSGELFTDESYSNNGIGLNSKIPNEVGRADVSVSNPDASLLEMQQNPDYYKFKVPSLRNVARTFPYMHDGRFSSLKKVLDHYDTDTEPFIQEMATLDVRLKNNSAVGIPMTEQEKEAIITFLNTLTDEDFISDPRFAKP